MMSKHTPGPWEVIQDIGYDGLQGWDIEANGKSIVGCEGILAGHENAEANARLIAAAPELLEALESCAERLAVHMKHTEDLASHMKAIAAIAKARGDA